MALSGTLAIPSSSPREKEGNSLDRGSRVLLLCFMSLT